jgi:hypothetical protein
MLTKKYIDQMQRYVVDEKGCWLFTGGKSPDGYGKLKILGKTVRAHRAYYEFYVGKIPDGLLVCHSCDVPICVNPEHLWVGTQLDNERDKTEKGRRPLSPALLHPETLLRGDKHPSKRTAFKERMSGDNNHMKQEKYRALYRGKIPANAKLTKEQALAIFLDTREAATIAADYGLHKNSVHRIKRGERWVATGAIPQELLIATNTKRRNRKYDT